MFIYFRKDTRKFSHSSSVENGGSWLYEFELADGQLGYTYVLKDDDTIVLGEEMPVSTMPPPDIAEFNLAALRRLRDLKLSETDWWAVSDRTMTAQQTAYRQALRDITQNYSSVAEAVWPEKPTGVN